MQSPRIESSHHFARKLDSSCAGRETGKSIFPSMASFQLDPGSYFIQMPTQEGRHALVIFPPGPQSLQDIRHMYELQDEENLPQIQSLKRTIVAGDGECRCLLKLGLNHCTH